MPVKVDRVLVSYAKICEVKAILHVGSQFLLIFCACLSFLTNFRIRDLHLMPLSSCEFSEIDAGRPNLTYRCAWTPYDI